jgi:hypothetical protein
MSSITIPFSLQAAFGVSEPARVCDENGKVIGYYTPVREATEEDYEWVMNQVTKEEIEASLKSGPGRPAAEVIAELRRKYGP